MFTRYSSAALKPCVKCNGTELRILHNHYDTSEAEFWVYEFAATQYCNKCERHDERGVYGRTFRSFGAFVANSCCDKPVTRIQVPLELSTVGIVERGIHASSTATKGSELRAHSTFISHLVTLECSERYKQALCAWAPAAMQAFMGNVKGASRKLRNGRLSSECHIPEVLKAYRPPPGLPSPTENKNVEKDNLVASLPANPDLNGTMPGTQLEGKEYGEEARVKGHAAHLADGKDMAFQVGPDLIPVEVFDSSVGNLKAGLAKRVKPLPYQADKKFEKKITKTVTALIRNVFSAEKIRAWRAKNPCVEELGSSKWSTERFNTALDSALSDTTTRIEQTFQIKNNEALPAKGKAPRPIIQCGDEAQVMMCIPVKCFEELLFEHFDEASIKHLTKHDAMGRVAKRFNFGKGIKAELIEGDGSAWDACCNKYIRDLTENRILRHIISVLGDDHEVPKKWFQLVLEDMEKPMLKGKAKVTDGTLTPIRVLIDAIRQSGHRGTSCFNYLINLIGWLCVLCEEPEKMVAYDRGHLPEWYVSAFDKQWYRLRYAFEGDDSALCTTQRIGQFSEEIESLWTKLGFRMKLVFVKNKLTFTGFEFLCNEFGVTNVFIPEVVRNFASSSWSTSSELKQFPYKVHSVGAAAMLARAENFKQCGPISAYFAAIGLAHVKKGGDTCLGEIEAMRLGIAPVKSVSQALQELYDSAEAMEQGMNSLVNLSIPLSNEQQLQMLSVDFGDDPLDLVLARSVVPFAVWDPKQFEKARR